jgi:8-oxo-dGTP pyrophosphatase MutT (NUDIX family)
MRVVTLERLRQCFRRIDADAAKAAHADFHRPSGKIAAAVLMPLVERDSGVTVLLTQRTAHLRDHAGQISFPGGRSEPGETDPMTTALRETQEEVGIQPDQVDVLGVLPGFETGTGFLVTPVVGVIRPPINLKIDDFEVAEAFEVPLRFLMNAANHQRMAVEIDGVRREFWAIPWHGYFIWGATAGMLISLREFATTGP